MSIIIIHLIISFLLDGLLSNTTDILLINASYFKTIYTIISLVVIFRYFEYPKKYLIILLITGILFDIVYTNTLLLNPFIFLVIYFVIKELNYYIPNNLLTINIKSILAIIIYNIITFILLNISNYYNYNLNHLLRITLRTLPMTIIYTSISYFLLKKIFFKKYDKKIK